MARAKHTSLVFKAKGDTITVALKRPGKPTQTNSERFPSEDEAQKAMKRLVYGAAGVPVPDHLQPEASSTSEAIPEQ